MCKRIETELTNFQVHNNHEIWHKCSNCTFEFDVKVYWQMRFDNWGYSDQNTNRIRQFGLSNNIFTNIKRYRFWSHNQVKENDVVNKAIVKSNLDKNACVIVRVGKSEEPVYIGEFNFIHVCSIC